jgi:hypothetical protein
LDEIAGSDFVRHQLRCRRQKTWFLPAALKEAISSDISFVAAGKKRGSIRISRDHLSSRALRGKVGRTGFRRLLSA